jgi:hypothetical protein
MLVYGKSSTDYALLGRNPGLAGTERAEIGSRAELGLVGQVGAGWGRLGRKNVPRTGAEGVTHSLVFAVMENKCLLIENKCWYTANKITYVE